MNKIKNVLGLSSSKSHCERTVHSLSTDPNPNKIIEKQLHGILFAIFSLIYSLSEISESFQDCIHTIEENNPFDKFMKSLRSCHKWQNGAKLLYACHYLINKLDIPFCSIFQTESLNNLLELSKNKHSPGFLINKSQHICIY